MPDGLDRSNETLRGHILGVGGRLCQLAGVDELLAHGGRCANAGPGFFHNITHRSAPQQGCPDVRRIVTVTAGAPELLALGLRPSDAGIDARLDHRSLEFRENP